MKGYSRASDSVNLVHAFHAWNAVAQANVWFGWVKSAANPADEPSRDLGLADGEAWQIRSWLSSTPVEVVYSQMVDERNERC